MSIFALITTIGVFRLFIEQLKASERKYQTANELMKNIVDSLDSVFISADSQRLGQVFFNIIKNAAQALGEDSSLSEPIIKIRAQKNNDSVRIEFENKL